MSTERTLKEEILRIRSENTGPVKLHISLGHAEYYELVYAIGIRCGTLFYEKAAVTHFMGFPLTHVETESLLKVEIL